MKIVISVICFLIYVIIIPMKILIVCIGNICRSPMAEGILMHKLKQKNIHATVDSAGTGPWHVGQHPDYRAIETAQQHGIDISKLVARLFVNTDFDKFDKIYVADEEVYSDVLSRAKNEKDIAKIDFLLNVFEPNSNKPVPDPYYGNQDGFETIFQLIDQACEKIVNELEKNSQLDKLDF